MIKHRAITARIAIIAVLAMLAVPGNVMAGACYDQYQQDLTNCTNMFPLWWQALALGACYASAQVLYENCIRDTPVT